MGSEHGRLAAVFTIAQDEPEFLPLWLQHYKKHFALSDIYVLDHVTPDPKNSARRNHAICDAQRVRPNAVYRDQAFDHRWLRDTVQLFQRYLLQSYRWVLFAEVDEFVMPRDLSVNMCSWLENGGGTSDVVRCAGYEVVHKWQEETTKLELTQPLLHQRQWYYRSRVYSKPVLSSVPLNWVVGFHDLCEEAGPEADESLLLLHLHKIDLELSLHRSQRSAARKWSEFDQSAGYGAQNRIADIDAMKNYFDTDADDPEHGPVNLVLIPDDLRGVI
jgi:hypothetical protein